MSDGAHGTDETGEVARHGAAGAQAPAGWHPDPAGSGMERWWDGTQWTEHRRWPHAPAPAAAPYERNPQVVPGTPVYTPFIWILTLLPLLSLLLLPWVLSEALSQMVAQLPERFATYTPGTSTRFSFETGPANLVAQLVSWLSWAATVLLAWLDHRALRSRGFVRPFHWAFAFIPAPVYPIGRSIVARRRSGRGIAPMWVAIALLALGLIGGIIATVAIFGAIPWSTLTPPGGSFRG
jgi:hypothetical protein